jgi:hypothetical protein
MTEGRASKCLSCNAVELPDSDDVICGACAHALPAAFRSVLQDRAARRARTTRSAEEDLRLDAWAWGTLIGGLIEAASRARVSLDDGQAPPPASQRH